MAARTQRLFLGPLLIATSLALSGCSSLFFYPDKTVYITPDRLNLDYRDVYLDTVDGERLHGWWIPAEGEDHGTVYYLHGNAQNMSSHILNVAWLPGEGYNVFMIDYRGYGESTGAPDVEGALTDTEAGFRWLVQQPDTGPYYLLGQSLGGGLGLMLAAEWTKRDEQPPLTAVVLDSTFAGFRAITQEKLDSFWLTWPFQIPLSWTIPDDYEGVDHVADISPVPLLVVHSIRDGVVPFHNGTILYTDARQPKQFLQTDTPHASTFVVPAYREAVAKFLENAAAGHMAADSGERRHTEPEN